jgi:hypothetical protein
VQVLHSDMMTSSHEIKFQIHANTDVPEPGMSVHINGTITRLTDHKGMRSEACTQESPNYEDVINDAVIYRSRRNLTSACLDRR